MRIESLDTTLRDGAQAEGVVFSREDKIKVVRRLDALGVDYIEAGNPSSNPKDDEFLRWAVKQLKLEHSRLVAFGATAKIGTAPEQSEGLARLVECGAEYASVFGKSSLFHVREVLHATSEQNLQTIAGSVRYLTDHGVHVFFDAEQFFDGYKDDPEYALAALLAAQGAGAKQLVLCDTNGATLPADMAAIVRAVVARVNLPVGIHTHDDTGLAVACALSAVEAGATQVQGTINGYGERCGNANLCTLLPDLMLLLKCDIGNVDISQLTSAARFVAEVANMALPKGTPYVGRSAFAHKGGMHQDAVQKNPRTYEHIPPEIVGNQRRLLISEVAGRGGLMQRLKKLAPELSKDSAQTRDIVTRMKEREWLGYSYEAAEGSLELLVLDSLGKRADYYEIVDYQVQSRQMNEERSALAIVKVRVDGREEISAAEGYGPVNALDNALRRALQVFYPCLNSMYLTDFKVRVLDSSGTASMVRVHIESSDGAHVWSTMGVSANIIEACLTALTESVTYMLIKETNGWQ